MINTEGKIVYAALSGGVDSAVAALVLSREGYNVMGVYMKTWSPYAEASEGQAAFCPWREERRDAMRVCAHLGIQFKMWDFTKEYKARVVDYMVREYAAGRTPNPDVMCNKKIKFGLFFDRATAEGADCIATGHYARIARPTKLQDTNCKLERARAREKDQSYFLWTLTQRHLAQTLFPVGEFKSKDAVRAYARTHGIPVADKPDSQGVCFVGPINIREFLEGYIPLSPGPIVSVAGQCLGEHRGLPFYTIGQREGIGIGGTGPYYVARKEEKTNTLVVSPPAREEELMSRELVASGLNWIGDAPRDGDVLETQVRYRQMPVHGGIRNQESGIRITFDETVRAITPGQSVVLYRGDTLLGGGIIR